MDQGISIDSSASAQEKPRARANQLPGQSIHTSLTRPCPPATRPPSLHPGLALASARSSCWACRALAWLLSTHQSPSFLLNSSPPTPISWRGRESRGQGSNSSLHSEK